MDEIFGSFDPDTGCKLKFESDLISTVKQIKQKLKQSSLALELSKRAVKCPVDIVHPISLSTRKLAVLRCIFTNLIFVVSVLGRLLIGNNSILLQGK